MSVQPFSVERQLRCPDSVMRLDRMGASFPTRLSFGRVLVRRLAAAAVKVERPVWRINAQGYGVAVYSLVLGGNRYSLVAFATELHDADRSDRVIAEAWDASFVLYDGLPDDAEIERLKANAPHQEAGRFEATDLVISRANKSVRLFQSVVEMLRAGKQPDPTELSKTGYLMRTTAVYGNGKFGIADRMLFADRPELAGPFAAEMLSVWLIREFTHDLAAHLGGQPLNAACRRALGIGNSTGLGMAPFLVTHPLLVNNWVTAREWALADARAQALLDCSQQSRYRKLLDRARTHVAQWAVEDGVQSTRIAKLTAELAEAPSDFGGRYPIERLLGWSADRSAECQELIAALAIEGLGDVVDGYAHCMAETDDAPPLNRSMSVEALSALIDQNYGWALAVDFSAREASQKFWYTSEEKLEPRIGNRFEEAGAELERPLDIARQVQSLFADLAHAISLRELLVAKPRHRGIVRRIQATAQRPYAEVRDNLLDAAVRPIDLLRFKLAFFGASKFDPKSDLWTRITLFQGAPTRDQLGADADDWWLPVF